MTPATSPKLLKVKKRLLATLGAWVDNDAAAANLDQSPKLNLLRCLPFIILHLSCLLVFFVSFSWAALLLCLFSYFIRMFAITGFYHRYFSHKTFSVPKWVEITFALIGASAAQRGPIWWAAHHRHHHKHSDEHDDQHSPVHQGLLKSHMLWFMNNKNFHIQKQHVRDLCKNRALRFIDRFDGLWPFVYLALLLLLGWFCQHYTSIPLDPLSAGVWGFSIATVLVFHATFSINSLAHRFGKRVYATKDNSRNNWLLAILTLGEGWHNNHHYWPASCRQGFKWYQLDISFLILNLFSKVGLVHNMRNIPNHKISQGECI